MLLAYPDGCLYFWSGIEVSEEEEERELREMAEEVSASLWSVGWDTLLVQLTTNGVDGRESVMCVCPTTVPPRGKLTHTLS